MQVLHEFNLLQNIFEDVFSMHFARYGLSWPKYKVLINLYMSGDYGLIQSELSAKLLVSRANITSLIERLEKEDLVIRRNDSADKRVFRVYLSNRAVALMHAFLPIHNDFVHKAMSSLSTSEKKELIFLLKKLNTGLD